MVSRETPRCPHISSTEDHRSTGAVRSVPEVAAITRLLWQIAYEIARSLIGFVTGRAAAARDVPPAEEPSWVSARRNYRDSIWCKSPGPALSLEISSLPFFTRD